MKLLILFICFTVLSQGYAQAGGAVEVIVDKQKVEETFHANGQKKTSAHKSKNKHGEWVVDGTVRTWYPSGSKRGEMYFAMGIREGTWKTYYENGKQFDQRVYKKGQPSGVWKRFSKEGTLIDESEFKKIDQEISEVHMKVYHTNGKLSQQGKWQRVLKPGKPPANFKEGNWQYFDEKGELLKSEFYKDGQLQEK